MEDEGQRLLRQWNRDSQRNNPDYWRSEDFRQAYARDIMPRHAEFYEARIRPELQNLMHLEPADDDQFENLAPEDAGYFAWPDQQLMQGGGVVVRVLSLGCGPGTDLLSICRILARNPIVSRIDCVGVDLIGHPFDPLIDQLRGILTRRSNLQIRFRNFSGIDMRDFVEYCERSGVKFNIVSARYTNIIDKVDLFRIRVPGLLFPGGRVLVEDNRSPTFLDLTNNGYIEEQADLANQAFLVFRQPRN